MGEPTLGRLPYAKFQFYRCRCFGIIAPQTMKIIRILLFEGYVHVRTLTYLILAYAAGKQE